MSAIWSLPPRPKRSKNTRGTFVSNPKIPKSPDVNCSECKFNFPLGTQSIYGVTPNPGEFQRRLNIERGSGGGGGHVMSLVNLDQDQTSAFLTWSVCMACRWCVCACACVCVGVGVYTRARAPHACSLASHIQCCHPPGRQSYYNTFQVYVHDCALTAREGISS